MFVIFLPSTNVMCGRRVVPKVASAMPVTSAVRRLAAVVRPKCANLSAIIGAQAVALAQAAAACSRRTFMAATTPPG